MDPTRLEAETEAIVFLIKSTLFSIVKRWNVENNCLFSDEGEIRELGMSRDVL